MTESPLAPQYTAPKFKTQSDFPDAQTSSSHTHAHFASTSAQQQATHSQLQSRPLSLSLTIGKRYSSPVRTRREDDMDELKDDDEERPAPRIRLVSASTSSPMAVAKSRKSSCDLCHHRKIKCDQIRPSCSSCTRKGKACHYDEETEHNNPYNRIQHRNNSVTVVSATNPGEKYTVDIPRPSVSSYPSTYSHAASSDDMYGIMNDEIVQNAGGKAGSTSSERSGSGDKSKVSARERIVNGFDSDSDGEEEHDTKSEIEGSKNDKRMGIANLIAERSIADEKDTPQVEKDKEEVDELESGDEKEAEISSTNKRREPTLDDELSGELLELASAPQAKKPKHHRPEVSIPTIHRPIRPTKGPVRTHSGPRSSLPSTLPSALPPTPISSISHAQNGFDAYTTPLQSLMTSLPSVETQTILFKTFFADPFLTEGVSLLRPQFLEDFRALIGRRFSRLREGDATTLANGFVFLATALRILPEETSKLLLASASNNSSSAASGSSLPKSLPRILSGLSASPADPTPLDQRYLDLALLASQVAEQSDIPSMMTVMLKLSLYRYSMLSFNKDRIILTGGWLAQAIKIAQALGMGKEWEGIPQGERELRRRVMWALYIADRQHSFETSFPYTIMDAHQGIHLPSPISEAELYKILPETPSLPPHSTEVGPTDCTALFIHTHLARRVTPVLDSLATVSAAGTPHDLILRFDASLDQFQDALPPYLRLFPMTDTQWDSAHPYLPPHRVRLHSILLAYRTGVHRTHLPTYLNPATPAGIRQVIAQLSLSTLRVQRSAKMLDPKVAPRLFNPATVFEAAATLALIMFVDKAVYMAKNPTTGLKALVNTPEYIALRGGMAEAGELLDNVGGCAESVMFARKAVAVLREIMSKVDAPVTQRILTSNGHASPPAKAESPEIGSPSRSTSLAPPTSPYLQNVVSWLETWRNVGMSIEYLMKEAEWPGAWEKVVTAMIQG